MVVLLSKSARDALGIDTVERGLIYSVLCLQLATAETPSESLITFGHAVSPPRISAQVKIKYNKPPSLRNAGDYLANIISFNDNDPGEFITSDPSVIQGEMIPADPFLLTSLEQYFIWLSYTLSASIYPETEYCRVSLIKEGTTDYLRINLSLPFNYQKFILTGNYIESVNKLTSFYVDSLGEIAENGALLPSPRYWHDPVGSLDSLKAIASSSLLPGTQAWVEDELSPYVFVDELPIIPDGLNYVSPDDEEGLRGWIKLLNGSAVWGKIINRPTIPTNTDQLMNDAGYITAAQAPVQSVNGQTGNVIITVGGGGGNGGNVTWETLTGKPTFEAIAFSADYDDLKNAPAIPTTTNQLFNDAGYITAAQAPVQSVNGQTGDVVIDIGNDIEVFELPFNASSSPPIDLPPGVLGGYNGIAQYLGASNIGSFNTYNMPGASFFFGLVFNQSLTDSGIDPIVFSSGIIQWVVYDLGSPWDIDAIDLFCKGNQENLTIKIQGSIDESIWTDLNESDYSILNEEWIRIIVSGNWQYIRFLKEADSGYGELIIREIEFYGSQGAGGGTADTGTYTLTDAEFNKICTSNRSLEEIHVVTIDANLNGLLLYIKNIGDGELLLEPDIGVAYKGVTSLEKDHLYILYRVSLNSYCLYDLEKINTWGNLSGSLYDQTDLVEELNSKESLVDLGEIDQYYAGDKTWKTLDAIAVGLNDVVNADTTNADNITSGTLAVARGGTGQITANDAINALMPSQTGQAGRILGTNGSSILWISTLDILSTTRNYYVRIDGSDSNNGLTNTAGGAFLTIPKAVDTVAGLVTNGFAVNIFLQAGIYTINAPIVLKDPVGSGKVTITSIGGMATIEVGGSYANPTSDPSSIFIAEGRSYIIGNLTLNNPTAFGLHHIVAWTGGQITINGTTFGNLGSHASFGSSHMIAFNSATLSITNTTYNVIGGHLTNTTVLTRHINCIRATATLRFGGTAAISGTVRLNGFYGGTVGSGIVATGRVYTGSLVTGCTKFILTGGSVLDTGGNTSAVPGSITGTTASGGQAV